MAEIALRYVPAAELDARKPGMHPVYAWTANWLLVMLEIYGAVDVLSLPRHPDNIVPEFV